MKILLHICCGVCAAGVIEQLQAEGNEVTGFFYNPNIAPKDEYERRFAAARVVAERTGTRLVETGYDHDSWLAVTEKYSAEREGGARCSECFAFRLKKTYEYFTAGGFDLFTTTLTVSPVKKAEVVNRIGKDIAGEKFLAADFKKKDGFKKAVDAAKKWGLYRQNYCGCEFSKR
ncbi:MAG TPA: epoxyqueuosine reductase QueH [Candidatus Omnitrophota bacterium]|nr:epoxyqueuosine reductase QueH [Candidatus Omnitrophota bacterium]HPS19643.1 epoxyqueuosine reductase QueH [Candidatus Omnitrophota bacterium]